MRFFGDAADDVISEYFMPRYLDPLVDLEKALNGEAPKDDESEAA